jgi:hypothetical protein
LRDYLSNQAYKLLDEVEMDRLIPAAVAAQLLGLGRASFSQSYINSGLVETAVAFNGAKRVLVKLDSLQTAVGRTFSDAEIEAAEARYDATEKVAARERQREVRAAANDAA